MLTVSLGTVRDRAAAGCAVVVTARVVRVAVMARNAAALRWAR